MLCNVCLLPPTTRPSITPSYLPTVASSVSHFPLQGGEVTRPLDPSSLSSSEPLPPPLIPLPKRRASDCEPAEEEAGREAPTLPQDLGTNLGLEVGEPEVAAEAYSEIGGSPTEEQAEISGDDKGTTGRENLSEAVFLFPH